MVMCRTGAFLVVFSAVVGQTLSQGSRDKVNIGVYYASHCGDSKDFINQQLWPAYLDMGHIVNIDLIPHGKTQERLLPNGTYEFICQRGPEECFSNMIQTCAIYLLRDIDIYLPFIQCMQSYANPMKAVRRCSRRVYVDYSLLESCATGPTGNKLQHEMAKRTQALSPPVNFVPWITVDGVYSPSMHEAAMEDIVSLLCKAYKGPRPDQCNKQAQFAAFKSFH